MGLFVMTTKRHIKKFLQNILEDPASYEDDDFDEDEILGQIIDLESAE